MRISDWSSDVCSSDLRDRRPFGGFGIGEREDRAFERREAPIAVERARDGGAETVPGGGGRGEDVAAPFGIGGDGKIEAGAAFTHHAQTHVLRVARRIDERRAFGRSAETTTELQSLKHKQDAGFFLKKNITIHTRNTLQLY